MFRGGTDDIGVDAWDGTGEVGDGPLPIIGPDAADCPDGAVGGGPIIPIPIGPGGRWCGWCGGRLAVVAGLGVDRLVLLVLAAGVVVGVGPVPGAADGIAMIAGSNMGGLGEGDGEGAGASRTWMSLMSDPLKMM